MGRSFLTPLRTFALAAIAAGLLGLAPTGALGATGALVSRSSQQLTLAGAPWRFIAFNSYQLTSLPGGYVCGRADSQATVDSIMQDAAASGANVIRTWFFQSYYDLGSHGQQVAPHFTAFDRVLSAAASYGLKVIPVLVNEYQQCEPQSVTKNLGFFQNGYQRPGYGYPLSFRSYATILARHYAGNPTIAFWQIGNELYDDTPSGCSASAESQGAQALRSFADTITGAIKSADPGHLVSLGTQGSGQCGLSGSDYPYVMGGAVDLCEYHDYDDVTASIPNDGYNRLWQRIQQCQALGKPLFVGESGIPANVDAQGEADGPITPASLQLRAGFYAAKMSAAFNAGVVGYGLWDKEQDASDSSYNLQSDGGFGIGPNGLDNDPTNAVVAGMAHTLGSYPGTVQSSFEDGGVDGWSVSGASGGLTAASSTTEAWDGSHSLALTLSGAAGDPQVATTQTSGATGGATITLHVFSPPDAAAGLSVQPFVTDQASATTLGAASTLVPGWNVITWTVPSTVTGPLSAVGVQVDDGSGWAGTLYLDSIAWGTPGSSPQSNIARVSLDTPTTSPAPSRPVTPSRARIRRGRAQRFNRRAGAARRTG